MARDVEAVLSAVAEAADGSIAAEAARVDRERMFPKAGIEALGAGGALGLVVGVDAGGAGGGLTALGDRLRARRRGVRVDRDGVPDARGHRGDDRDRRRRRGPPSCCVRDGARVGCWERSPSASAAPARTSTPRSSRRHGRTAPSRSRAARASSPRAATPTSTCVLVQGGAEEGTADAYLVDRDDPGVRFDGDWDGPRDGRQLEHRRSTLDDVELGDGCADRRGRARRLDLVFGVVAPFFLVGLAAVNVGIAAAAAAAATRACGGPPLPGRLVARRGAVRPAPARRHGPRRADRRGCSCATRPRSATPATSRRSSRSWRRRSPRPRRRPP